MKKLERPDQYRYIRDNTNTTVQDVAEALVPLMLRARDFDETHAPQYCLALKGKINDLRAILKDFELSVDERIKEAS
jgi:hypothetical protein